EGGGKDNERERTGRTTMHATGRGGEAGADRTDQANRVGRGIVRGVRPHPAAFFHRRRDQILGVDRLKHAAKNQRRVIAPFGWVSEYGPSRDRMSVLDVTRKDANSCTKSPHFDHFFESRFRRPAVVFPRALYDALAATPACTIADDRFPVS